MYCSHLEMCVCVVDMYVAECTHRAAPHYLPLITNMADSRQLE